MLHGSMSAAGFVFWGALGAILYSYFVYPLIVALMVKLRGKRQVIVADTARPFVSVVISLYNEEGVLAEKLANLGEINYPAGRIEFIFGSDGSTDRTNALLGAWPSPGKNVLVFDRRRGKAPVLNDCVPAARGDLIVFSDANTLFRPDTVINLVREFAAPDVGGVCGELVLQPEGADPGGAGEASYWSYEKWLKRSESEYATLLGATGGVYAIRRSLFVPLPTHKSVTDDFLIPLQIVKQGYRIVYARDALAYEKTSGSMKGEFRRKARIGAQNYAGIPEFASLLSPLAGFVAFALWSHKIIRWFVPFLAIAAAAASFVLARESGFYAVIVMLEIVFLLAAAVGLVADRAKVSLGHLSLPYYITSMNAALLVGFFRFLFGKQRTTWEVLR